jgi:hypothetical protein
MALCGVVAAGSVRLIDLAFPIVLVVMPGTWTREVLDATFEEYEKLFARGERYVLITDTSDEEGNVFAKERRAMADWANQPRVRELSARLCVGTATVVSSPAQRALLTGLMWFFHPASPLHPVGTLDEATTWALAKAKEAGLTLRSTPEQVRITLRREVAKVRAA